MSDHEAEQPLLGGGRGGSAQQPGRPSYASITRPPRLVDEDDDTQSTSSTVTPERATMLARTDWIALAVASGACAAFNGVFAKLTTTELTSSFAGAVSGSLLGLAGDSTAAKAIEIAMRGLFFVLNLVFNGVMWALFTTALSRGSSTTRVSIINVSSNFVITAVLGFFIFAEALPPLWWVGAALLVAGNVIIGRRDEGHQDGKKAGAPQDDVESANSEEEDLLLEEPVQLEEELKSGQDESEGVS